MRFRCSIECPANAKVNSLLLYLCMYVLKFHRMSMFLQTGDDISLDNNRNYLSSGLTCTLLNLLSNYRKYSASSLAVSKRIIHLVSTPHIHSCSQTYSYIHANIHTYIHTYIHIHTYTRSESCRRQEFLNQIWRAIFHCLRWDTVHTYIHMYIHTYIHTYIHIYIHTYIQMRQQP